MSLLTYLLQASVCMAIFYGFYLLALQKQNTFQLNRWYLLSTLLLSCIIPLVKIYIDSRPDNIVSTTTPVIIGTYLDGLDYATVVATARPFDWIRVLIASYVTGVCVFFVRFLFEIKRIWTIIKSAERVTFQDQTFYLSPSVKSPFSFFDKIFFPAGHNFSDEEIVKVMEHERAHLHGGHTWDILLVSIVSIFFWINPVVYLYRRSLREVHEFLADAAVVKDNDWEHYAAFLISQKNHGLQHQLSHQLVYSQLKNRLLMMTKPPSTPVSRFKYFGLIPVCLLTIMLFSFREKADRSYTENKVYNIYEDGLKVWTVLDNNKREDTIPDAYIHSLRNVKPAEATAPLANPPYTRSLPIFPGCEKVPFPEMGNCGMEKLSDYINQHMTYPASLKKGGVEGKVIVRFVVGADGYVKDVAIERSLHPDADKIVLDVFNSMNKKAGKWQPAAKHGQLLDSEMTLPVQFKLENSFAESAPAQAEPYTYVSEMPRFKGSEDLPQNDIVGSSQLIYQFVSKHLRYPEEEKAAGVEGMVIVQFIVREDGYISDANIVRGINPNLNREVLRVVEAMNEPEPHWIPGRENGKVVPVVFTLPVRFKLTDTDKKLPDLWEGKALESADKPVENDWLKVKPNPAGNIIELETFEEGVSIKITNLEKKLMWQQDAIADKQQIRIDVSGWPAGQYWIYVTKNEMLKMAGFIVQH